MCIRDSHHTGIQAWRKLIAKIIRVPVNRIIQPAEDWFKNIATKEIRHRPGRHNRIDIGPGHVDVCYCFRHNRRDLKRPLSEEINKLYAIAVKKIKTIN